MKIDLIFTKETVTNIILDNNLFYTVNNTYVIIHMVLKYFKSFY